MKQFNILQRAALFAATFALGLAAATTAAQDGYEPANPRPGDVPPGWQVKPKPGQVPPGWQVALKLGFQGGYVVIPATQDRVIRSRDGIVTQVNLNGPVEIHYVDPATDPRNQSRDVVAELGVGDMIKAISYPQ